MVNNEGVERIFPLHSPFISKVTVKRGGETRRAKLFYLRERVGKAVKLAEKRGVAGAAKKVEASVEAKAGGARELAASAT
jgi:large subunit ribosomal protein L19